MDQIEHLQDQIARAERLARDAFDKLTIERLRAFADECRAKRKAIADGQIAGWVTENKLRSAGW